MKKISGAVKEIYRMDELASRNVWINKVHPLAKFLVTVIYIVLIVSYGKYDLTGVVLMAAYPSAIFVLGEISFKNCIKRLRLVLPLVCVVGILNPLFERTPVAVIGTFVVTTGIVSMLTLIAKGILCVLVSYLLVATTGIEKICYALRMLHVPSILVTEVLLVYRYLSVLLAEVGKLTDAYALRAPGQKGIHFRVWGTLAGQLLMRSMDRASVLYESMILRGFCGEFNCAEVLSWKKSDMVYLLAIVIPLFLFRIRL